VPLKRNQEIKKYFMAQCVSRERFWGKSGFAGFPKNKLILL